MPRRPDLAWHSIETNEFGLDGFMRWSVKARVEPMLAVNLGTRGVAEAVDLIEYTNIPGGTALSHLRVAMGRKTRTASGCGVRATSWTAQGRSATTRHMSTGGWPPRRPRAMRLVTPGVELVVCGSSSRSMPTFAEWEAEVLEHAYDQVDYVSCHASNEGFDRDLAVLPPVSWPMLRLSAESPRGIRT